MWAAAPRSKRPQIHTPATNSSSGEPLATADHHLPFFVRCDVLEFFTFWSGPDHSHGAVFAVGWEIPFTVNTFCDVSAATRKTSGWNRSKAIPSPIGYCADARNRPYLRYDRRPHSENQICRWSGRSYLSREEGGALGGAREAKAGHRQGCSNTRGRCS